MSGKMALVVEDAPAQINLMKGILASLGWTVTVSQDGDDLEALLSDGNFGIVVMDVRLPGVSGLTLARELKGDSRFRDVPVLLVSALPLSTTDIERLEGSSNAFLEKPFSAAQFVQAVQAIAP